MTWLSWLYLIAALALAPVFSVLVYVWAFMFWDWVIGEMGRRWRAARVEKAGKDFDKSLPDK
jgi:hypothetical protein